MTTTLPTPFEFCFYAIHIEQRLYFQVLFTGSINIIIIISRNLRIIYQ